MASFDRPTPEYNQQSPLRSLLAKLFGGGSVGAAQNAPGAAMPMPPTDAEADILEQRRTVDGPMTDANMPRPVSQEYIAPEGSLGGMPITEGQNANIGDDSRLRAMEMIAALRRGGAL